MPRFSEILDKIRRSNQPAFSSPSYSQYPVPAPGQFIGDGGASSELMPSAGPVRNHRPHMIYKNGFAE
jgi:hypothetical protein